MPLRYSRARQEEAAMVVRLLMHPLAEDVFVFLSLGSILLSVGLVGSLLWSLPADDDLPSSARTSIVTASVTSVPAPTSARSVACVRHSGFVARATVVDCRR
jgi:hypothetical protein